MDCCTIPAGVQPASVSAELGHVPIVERAIKSIVPSLENETLDKPVDPDDPEVQALVDSIREHGIKEPIALPRMAVSFPGIADILRPVS